MENESTPPKPYTRYKSSRLRLRNKPLKVPEPGQPPKRGGRSAGPPGAGVPKRKGRWARRIGIALLILLVILLVLAGVIYWRIDRAVKASNAKVPAGVHQVLKPATSGPENILFLGSDQRPGESSRSDTLLIMRVDGNSNTISQLSIPRDTLTDVPGYGQGKINSAFAYGGPALEIQTVENLTGIPINHFVELDFSGFPAIVDALGGVDIDVPKTIDSQYPSGLDWTQVHFDPGMQHMDGQRALIYVRVRYSDDDFQRMGRQQQFMEALQKKMSGLNTFKLPWLAPDIVDNVVTDMSTSDLMRLGWTKFRTPPERNRKFVLPGTPEDIGGVSYVVLDSGDTQKTIRDFLATGA